MSLTIKPIDTNLPAAKILGHGARPGIAELSQGPIARPELLARANDRKLDARTRHLAVASLARVSDPAVVGELESLVKAEAAVALPAIKALGLRGTVATLEQLGPTIADRRGSRALRQASSFAAALIAHRFDVDGFDLKRPSTHAYLAVAKDALRDMKFAAAPVSEQSRLRESLAESAPGIRPAERGWTIECRDRQSTLIFDAQTAKAWDAKAFAKRRVYVGQVALRSATTGEYAPGLTILCDPDGKGGIEIGLYRGSGILMMGGTGRIVGEQIEMRLGSVDRIGAFPMELSLRASPTDVTLITGRVARRMNSRAQPRPAKPINP